MAVPIEAAAGAEGILEYFRRDETDGFKRLFLRGALLVMAGIACVIFAELHRASRTFIWLLPTGVLTVASGPLTALLGLRRLLAEECYVAVRRDGVVLARPAAPPLLVAWDAVAKVRFDARSGLAVIERTGGAPPLPIDVRLGEVDGKELAKRLEAYRRRAHFGLLG